MWGLILSSHNLPSLSFPEMIIIVINKNSQEIGVTGTDTTRPRSRGTEHYIASRRRIFSPPPQKGFVLSHNSHSHSPLEPLRLLLVSLSQGGGGWNTPWHIRSRTRLGAILSLSVPPPLPPPSNAERRTGRKVRTESSICGAVWRKRAN